MMLPRVFVLCVSLAGLSPVYAEIVSEKESLPFPGIRLLERETSDPPQRIVAAFIDLEAPSLRVNATAPTRQLRSVEEWAEETGALLAVNGDFYRFHEGTPHVYGDAVGGGDAWPLRQTGKDPAYSDAWFFNRYGWIAFGGDENAVTFSNTRLVKENDDRYGATRGWRPGEVTHEIPPRTRALISGFSQLVIEGKPVRCEDPSERSCFPDRGDMSARHPRTAMGLTEDLKTFILVVVDGRSPSATGMYGAELAALMHELGAWTAFNLDGGGSSQMYVKGRGIVNEPSQIPYRKVLNHWGIFGRAK